MATQERSLHTLSNFELKEYYTWFIQSQIQGTLLRIRHHPDINKLRCTIEVAGKHKLVDIEVPKDKLPKPIKFKHTYTDVEEGFIKDK